MKLPNIVAFEGAPKIKEARLAAPRLENYLEPNLTDNEVRASGKFFSSIDTSSPGFEDFRKFPGIFFQTYGHRTPQEEADVTAIFLNEIKNIDYTSLLYPGTEQDLKQAIKAYGADIKQLFLWSQGDINNTGLQTHKIYKSGLLKSVMASDEAQVMRGKVHWAVDENKFLNLGNKIGSTENGELPKVVVIEDRIKNIERVLEKNPKAFPIWAAYGKTGAVMDPEPKSQYKTRYHGVESFGEIAQRAQEFGPVFKDAIVLLDFDGVLMDNQKSREVNGKALLKAIIGGLNLSSEQRKELVEHILNKIEHNK